MSDFKFSCPECGQHLSGDARYAGAQITCPACSNTIIVPEAPIPVVSMAGAGAAPKAPSIAMAPARPATPPPPPPTKARSAAGPTRTSGLAIASLICSVGSFLILPFGFIPGIICGHMARKRLARDPRLTGHGLAKTGLIVGYVALGLNVIAIIGLVVFFLAFGSRIREQVQQGSFGQARERSMPGPPGPRLNRFPAPPRNLPGPPRPGNVVPPPEEELIDTTPDGSGWTLNLSDATIPAEPVNGRIHGQKFRLQTVTLGAGWLKFVQGTGFLTDLEMDVVLFVSDPRELVGKKYSFGPEDEFGMRPHVHMEWKNQQQRTETKSWVNKYALQLEFGQPANGRLPGKIYLCVPDKDKSFIRGTFQMPMQLQ